MKPFTIKEKDFGLILPLTFSVHAIWICSSCKHWSEEFYFHYKPETILIPEERANCFLTNNIDALPRSEIIDKDAEGKAIEGFNIVQVKLHNGGFSCFLDVNLPLT